jgi:hypothetical protein
MQKLPSRWHLLMRLIKCEKHGCIILNASRKAYFGCEYFTPRHLCGCNMSYLRSIDIEISYYIVIWAEVDPKRHYDMRNTEIKRYSNNWIIRNDS